jgi:quinol monooxygenase YgiN
MAEVTVVARIEAKPGHEAAVEQALRGAVVATHQERDCLRYALHRELDQPRAFFLVERWTSRRALDEHLETPHLRELIGLLDGKTARDIDIWVLELLPGGDPIKGGM